MKEHRAVAIEERAELASPWRLRHAFGESSFVLLENPGFPSELGRWAILAGDPFLVFRSKRERVEVGPPGALEPVAGAPLDVLAGLFERYRGHERVWRPGMPPFVAGVVGYLGYELLYSLEPTVPDQGEDDHAVPDAYLLFCGSTVAVDLETGRGFLITQAFAPSRTEAEARANAALRSLAARVATPLPELDGDELRRLRDQRRQARPRLDERDVRAAGFTPRVSRDRYLDIVRAAKDHILQGDLSEVCTTQRFDTRWTGDGAHLYEVLRAVNPAPFAAYLRFPEVEVMSSSPERFVRLDREGWAETRPIKGTRPRGATPEEDALLKRDLETALKDRAENVMIVDLCRNDLGRVCRFGSVHVPELLKVETHPFTFQLVSTVVGQMNEGLGPIDLIRAAFPGGSMTGAPKVQAMKVIDSLEPVKRGVFSGSIGYIDAEGAMDLSIVIRTFVKRGDFLSFHVGGAIVSDSDPAEEYQETLDKAYGLISAFELAVTG